MKVLKSTIPAILLSLAATVPAFSQQSAPTSPAAKPAADDCKSLRQKALLTGGPDVLRLLAEAQAVCRKSQQAIARDKQPVPWAVATLDLANVTADRAIIGGSGGSGSGGASMALQGLDEAVDLDRQVLAVLSAEKSPEVWAAAQMNLGSALQSRGIRTNGEAGMPYLQEAADHLRQALQRLDAVKEPQNWAETQNNLGLALAELGTRKGKPAGNPLLEEAFQTFGTVQKVYTPEKNLHRWSEARLAQARVLLALERFNDADPVLQEVTDKDPDNRRALLTYVSLLGGRLERPADAASLTAKWLNRHADDLDVQILNLENLYASGRLAESRIRAVGLSEKAAGLPPAIRISLMGYEIATALATGSKDAPDHLGSLITLVAAQPADFHIAGNFAGSLRFIQSRQDLRNSDWQIQLFHALQNRNGRDAILTDLRKLESDMAGTG